MTDRLPIAKRAATTSAAPPRARLTAHSAKRWALAQTLPRYGYDGIDTDAVLIAHKTRPRQRSFVCGYVDGSYEWTQADWDLFKGELHITIATQAYINDGDVLDVENGDATPDQAEGWIRTRKLAGYYRPTIYCSRVTIPAVRAGTGRYVLGKDYDIWVADWTGVPHEIRGCAVTQYASATWADFDVAYDPLWPHRKPLKPGPTPPSPPPVHVPLQRVQATGTVSLSQAARFYGVPVDEIVSCSLDHETAANKKALLGYLTDHAGVMPKGLTYWVPAHPAKG